MRIVILVWLFPPRFIGGTEIATYNIAKHLAKRGYDVHIVTSWAKGLPKKSFEQGFHIHRIYAPRIRILGSIKWCIHVLLLLKRLRPDVIHTQGMGMSLDCFFAKMLFEKPYIIWGQGSDVYLSWRFKGMISRLVLKNADAVIALTKDMEKRMKKFCNRYIHVIPNGIDLKVFEKSSPRKLLPNLQITNSERILLFVGTLRPVKGLKYLIQAMNILRNTGVEKVKLIIIGDGEERQALKHLVKQLHLEDRVIFVGKIPNEKVPNYMTIADIFVLPSLSEGFPIVTLEAMASGLPIIASRIGGMPEIVEDGVNGFLVEPANPRDIAEKVTFLLKDEELRGRISKKNKEKIKNYSWEKIIEKLEEIFLEVIY
jgi:N-acetyl-alpha-D-glucosaminyl L-malate synthase BshA